jgi:hypoxanthine phosphoribosyltransferase
VLIVEELIDTGKSLKFLYDRLIQSKPASLEMVSLLNKSKKREVDISVKYIGREIDDLFLVGYGLDQNEQFRNASNLCSIQVI